MHGLRLALLGEGQGHVSGAIWACQDAPGTWVWLEAGALRGGEALCYSYVILR